MKQHLEKILHFSRNNKKVFHNLFFVFGFRIVQKILTIAMLYVFVRHVDKAGFGYYNLILTFISIVSLLALPGVGNALMQAIARGYVGTYAKSLRYTVIGSSIGSLILAIAAIWYWGKEPQLAMGFIIAATALPFVQGLNFWKNIYKGIEDFKTISKQGVLLSILRSGTMITALLLVPNNYILPLALFLGLSALQNIFFTTKSLQKAKTMPSRGVEDGAIKYGIKTTLYSSVNTIANHIDKIVLFFFLSPEALAIFIAAEKIPEMAKSVIQDIGTVVAPKFAKLEKYTLKLNTIINLFSLAVAAGILLVTFTILPWIVTFIFSHDYSEAVHYTQALMCSVAIGNAAQMRSRFIMAKLDSKSFKDMTYIISATRIVASITLIPLLGIWGAVISALLYRIIMVLVVNRIIKKRYNYQEN